MERDFKQPPLWILNRMVTIRKLLNERITESSPGKREVWFSDNGGQTVNRKVSLKLVEIGSGKKNYVFDYLAK